MDSSRSVHFRTRFAWFSVLVLCLLTHLAFSQPPPGYYDSALGLEGEQLRQALHGIIRDHQRYPYTSTATDTWDILELADEDPGNPNNILDIYRNRSHPKTDHWSSSNTTGWNREHSWPSSYGFTNDNSCNYPYTDAHHLFACNGDYNSARSNRPFDLCPSGCTEYPVDTLPYSNWGGGSFSSGTWEVWELRKGDIARALLYMDVRYEGGNHGITGCAEPDLILTDNRELIVSNTSSNESVAYMGVLSVLLAWHIEDPVDNQERLRNDIVYSFQGNRNPFIDHPEFVCALWGITGCSTGDTTPPAEPTNLTATGGSGSVQLDWADNTESDLAGYHVYRSTTSGASYSRITTTPVASSDYLDSAVSAGITYYYAVTAVDTSNNQSGLSNEASATPSGSGGESPLDIGGYVIEQLKSGTTLSISLPAGTTIQPGGTVIVGRDATQEQFESFWGPLPSNAVYINGKAVIGGNGFPVINGGQEYRLFDATATQVDPLSGYHPGTGPILAERSYQRDATDAETFTVLTSPNTTATPGVFDGTTANTGKVLITEFSDATGTGNFVYEFVELYYDPLPPPPPPIDAGGYVVEQLKSGTTLSIAIPAGTMVEPGGTLIVGRDATKEQFEAFWGPLPSNVVYINGKAVIGGNGFPVINGGQEYRLFDNIATQVDPASGYHPGTGPILAERSYQRVATDLNDFSVFSSPNTNATPGVHSGTSAGTGKLLITEFSDATGTGNFVYEFVELYYDAGTGGGGGGDTTPPAVPTGLGATAGDGLVDLDWNDNAEGDLAGYNVYRSTTSGGSYGLVASLLATSAYSDSAVTNGTTYYYVVTAVDTSSNESASSSEAAATPTAPPDTTPPIAPTGLAATAGNAVVDLGWNANTESDLAGYNVYRSTTSGSGYVKLNASLLTSSAYNDSAVANGTTYYYVVTAVDTSSNESASSSEVFATPQPPAGPESVHVADITLTTLSLNKGFKRGRAVVTVVDNLGNPVAGATVSGTFNGSFNEGASAQTNSSGVATIDTAATVKGSVSFTFCVDNVAGSLPYNAPANVETCDSI